MNIAVILHVLNATHPYLTVNNAILMVKLVCNATQTVQILIYYKEFV